MTEEIIKSITAAEEEGAAMKRTALERAAQILSNAQAQASGVEKSAAQTCKAYRDAQIKRAQEDAEQEYEAALRAKKAEAKDYCEEALEGADASVTKIVGRILGGDR